MELAGTHQADSATPRSAVGAAPVARVTSIGVAPAPPTLTLVAPSRGVYERHGKRALDVLVAAAVLVALAPVMSIVWLSLRLALGRDVVISQERVGLGSENFGMYKFRTMKWSRRGRGPATAYHGPDRRRTHKADHDPRHTPLGRALRKASIDELPQLFNVLTGDMSLVGPRPELATVVDSIGQRQHPRHRVRPGMTGEWQVTTRQTGLPLHECFDEDLPYLERVTFLNDVRILVRTVGVVLGRSGR